jgi:hypothetical protein
MQVGDQAEQLGGIASGDADVILDDPDGDRDPAAVTDGSFTNGNTYKWYVEACDQRVCSVPTATQSDQWVSCTAATYGDGQRHHHRGGRQLRRRNQRLWRMRRLGLNRGGLYDSGPTFVYTGKRRPDLGRGERSVHRVQGRMRRAAALR